LTEYGARLVKEACKAHPGRKIALDQYVEIEGRLQLLRGGGLRKRQHREKQ
jgi:hypothetical protein